MAGRVEQAMYQIPEKGRFLNDSSVDPKQDITGVGWYYRHPPNYEQLLQVAEKIGLTPDHDIPTKMGVWRVYKRDNLAIPNFQGKATLVNEALALYESNESEGKISSAILRLSPSDKPFTPEELARDLKVFTHYYVKRPRLLGFPSRALTWFHQGPTLPLLSLPLVGAAVGWMAPVGWMISPSESTFIFEDIAVLHILNALIGALSGAATNSILYGLGALSEKRAKGKIPHKDEYMAGNHAVSTLLEQKGHIQRTSILEEVYASLQHDKPTLTPDEFLEYIAPL